ncbi:MAG: tetratricopeptide repeat protein [Elusimicrobia bacterium]|nr:tetratricopeptide repeat protein [Elusimicrobiota bacterium]
MGLGRDSFLTRFLPPVLVAAAAFAAFLPALSAGFVSWDDQIIIIDNPFYRGLGLTQVRWMFTNFLAGHYHPVTWLSFGLDHGLWGMDPAGYHLTSLVIHSLNAALLSLVAGRLLSSAALPGGESDAWTLPAAAFSALVFAVHPLRTESVAWVTERRDVVCGLFFLCAVLCHLRDAESPSRRWKAAALGAHVLALLSKSMSVTLPFVLLLLDVYPLRRLPADPRKWFQRGHLDRVKEKVPFLIASAAAGAAAYVHTTWVEPIRPMVDLGLAQRAALASYSLVFYVAKTLWPARLLPIYELPQPFDPCQAVFAASAAAVLAASAVAWKWGARFPGSCSAAAFYVLTAAPVVGLVPIGFHLAADRYSYIPCMGWAVLAGAGLRSLLLMSGALGRGMTLSAAACLAVLLGGLSWRQTGFWKDSFTLWRRVLSIAPDTAVARNNLAAALAMEGRFGEAAEHLRKARRLRPANMEYRKRLAVFLYNQGNGLLQAGRFREAVPLYQEAAALAPGSADLYNNLGLAFAAAGRLDEACRHYARAVAVDGRSALAEYNWGNALLAQGRLPEAQKRYELALKKDPGFQEARFNLGNVLARRGAYRGALAQYRAVLRAAPRHPGLRENMETVRRLAAAAQR